MKKTSELDGLTEMAKTRIFRPSTRPIYYATQIPKNNGELRTIYATNDIYEKEAQRHVYKCLNNVFDKTFEECSYAYRHNRNAHMALYALFDAIGDGKDHVLKLDIKACFDNLPRRVIVNSIKERNDDSAMLGFVESVMSTKYRDVNGNIVNKPRGILQGTILAPLLCNVALDKLDKYVMRACAGVTYIRYADDIILLGHSKTSIRKAKRAIAGYLKDRFKMSLKEEKEVYADLRNESVTFLGFNIMLKDGRTLIRPKSTAWVKLKRCLNRKALVGERNHAIARIIGWAEYYCIHGIIRKQFLREIEGSKLDKITKKIVRAHVQGKSVQA